MKKFISIFLCVTLLAASALAFSGCTGAKELNYSVVLITDGGTVNDGAYNESAWKGVSEYAEEAGLTYRYYQPVLEDDKLNNDTVLSYIDLAVQSGAQYIVMPTSALEVAAYEGAQKHNDVKFILVDGMPHTAESDEAVRADNLMCVTFDELQSGFLAGYNAVVAGNTKLGYFGEYYSDASRKYGAGFVQGAAYAADQLGIPATMKYADYDSPVLDYNYSFTITANYAKIEDIDEKVFKINVVNGIGSGTYTEGSNVTLIADPAPEDKVFDHWEVKSDTDGVKDSKVNLSTKSKTTTNLLVEKCDATITAVYKDAENATFPLTIMNNTNTEPYSTQYLAVGDYEITAPAAESGMVFDHWEIKDYDSPELVLDDVNSKNTWVHTGKDLLTLIPVYVKSTVPTFDVTVITGEGGNGESTGSGSYVTGDNVSVSAAVPQDGYIFTHWSNADTYGYGAGISMANEYYPNTSFSMVNRYQSVVETMYDEGVSIIYAGGNNECNVVSDATWNYSYLKEAIGSENWQADWTHYYSTTTKDYGAAIKLCLAEFAGGTTLVGDCANNCIAMTYVAEENTDSYDAVYEALGKGELNPAVLADDEDVTAVLNSNCLTLDYWVVEE